MLATDYPNNEGHVTLMYIHSRNIYYREHGIDVTVLNFAAKNRYAFQNIPVITLSNYENENNDYDVLVCHAANLRNHYRFLKKYGDRFSRFVFFFHGHEVLRIRETYSTPYSYMKTKSITNTFVQDLYDAYKLHTWKKYYLTVKDKSQFIFVSGWMKDKFEYYVGIDLSMFKTYIIPNSVGDVFQKERFQKDTLKQYDFVTIRSNIDGSKYCIDLINQIALDNPKYKFLVVGKGAFFKYHDKAPNITWEDRGLVHQEIPEVLNSARCALMPTRLDAQGVMMCEMATYGIPVITSDIDICQELSKTFKNMILIENGETIDLSKYEAIIKKMYEIPKNEALYSENTVKKEVQIIQGIFG